MPPVDKDETTLMNYLRHAGLVDSKVNKIWEMVYLYVYCKFYYKVVKIYVLSKGFLGSGLVIGF